MDSRLETRLPEHLDSRSSMRASNCAPLKSLDDMTHPSPVCGRSKALQRHRAFWRAATIITMLATIGISAWLGREPLLRGAASLWIVSDPVTRADAIVVLSGNYYERPLVAADLYRRGFANKILVSHTASTQQTPVPISPTDSELNRTALLKLGVPPGAIEYFGNANSNTRKEAVAIRQWAERNAASAFIIPTEMFSARRVRWIFQRELSGRGVIIEVPSFEPLGYTRGEWWKAEQGVIAFQNELIKYIYYRLKY
jgi:uncharacterized SAM-binding protein YcdF (DUF218 family)